MSPKMKTKNNKCTSSFLKTRSQATAFRINMDVGKERSTLGEYLHSLTVSLIFNLAFS